MLLNARYLAERATVLTSNDRPAALPARLHSRIAELAQIVWMPINDYRRIGAGHEGSTMDGYFGWEVGAAGRRGALPMRKNRPAGYPNRSALVGVRQGRITTCPYLPLARVPFPDAPAFS